MRYLLLVQLLFLALLLASFGNVTQEQVNVRLVTDEAEAVLTILAKKKRTRQSPTLIGNNSSQLKVTFDQATRNINAAFVRGC